MVQKKIPDFFIVGAPRSGTTALARYLSAHPEIFMPREKEMHYFGSDLITASAYREREKYLAEFEEASDVKRIGEASVWYLYSEKAPLEIKEFNPGSSIIIMIRNPVEMIYSLHAKLIITGNENIKDFAKALSMEQERKERWLSHYGSLPVVPNLYRENARLSPHIEKYIRVFGKHRVHVIIYDDFKADTAAEYKKALEFLEVDPEVKPDFSPVNAHQGVRSNLLFRFLRGLPPGFWKLRRALLPKNAHFGIPLIKMNLKKEQRRRMDPGLETKLKAELVPEVERLSEMLGRDLTHWCK